MADRGHWIKLWTIALSDKQTANLSCRDFGRFIRLMLYTKLEGTDGVLEVEIPGRFICPMLGVSNLERLAESILILPGVECEKHEDEEGIVALTIRFKNWEKYQSPIDPTSASRQERYRQKHNAEGVSNGVTTPLRGGVTAVTSAVTPSVSVSSSKGIKEESEKPLRENGYSAETKRVTESFVSALNEKTGQHYKINSKATLEAINARIAEGFKEADFLSVVNKKCKEWIGTEWEKHLNPETLLRPKKFEKYVNQNITEGKKKIGVGHVSDFKEGQF